MDQDYDRALEQLEIASHLSPSNEDIVRLIAAIKRRQGKWEQSLEAYERVAYIDPRNTNSFREVVFTNVAMRRWPEAARWAKRMREMAPGSLVPNIQSGYIDFWWNEDAQTLKSFLDQLPAGRRSGWQCDWLSMGPRNAAARLFCSQKDSPNFVG